MSEWQTFAVVSGGAAGALTGLLFVAVSIRIDVIAASRALRNRATQALVLFVIPLFLAIPEQTYEALGAELLALVAAFGAIMLVLDRRARSDQGGPTDDRSVAALLDAIAPNTITLVLLAVAAVLLIAGLHGGLYVLVAPVIVALAGGVVSAWLLLVRLAAGSVPG